MALPTWAALWDDEAEKMRLFYAVAKGTVEQVRALLDARADSNARDYEERCPLHVAAGRGSVPIIDLLIERGAQLDAPDIFGNTPLQQATRCGQHRASKLFKDKGAKSQVVGVQMHSVLQWELDRADIRVGTELVRTWKSVLHKGTWNGNDVVVKCALPGETASDAQGVDSELLHELSILASVRHPDLVMFLGCCVEESPAMIVTEFQPNGDLERYYEAKMDEKNAIWVAPCEMINRWGCGILRALRYLHNWRTPIIHRDLKPMNVLLTADLHAKVVDFGTSKSGEWSTADLQAMDAGRGSEAAPLVNIQRKWSNMTRGVGSWRYMAPEVARGEEYTESVDIYSWGLILYFLSSGRQPFHEFRHAKQVLDEFSSNREPRPKASECPPRYRPIMEAAWHVDPRERPNAYDLVEWMADIQGAKTCACGLMRAFSSGALRQDRGAEHESARLVDMKVW